jgi:hypothetical protein
MAELIIQLQKKDGTFHCEKFDNLPSPKSVYVAICFTDNDQSEKLAIDLKTALINSISNLGGGFDSSTPPCNGNVNAFGTCQALAVPENTKLLIVVSDGTSNSFTNKDILNWSENILPVLKAGSNVDLPAPLKNPQAVFWNSGIEEVLSNIYALIGISDEDLRIFISYKRSDTSDFAEQLFDRLNHEGFEVFLDRFSIRPGINFQSRLYQELADKSMVIFLESQNFLDSAWVEKEIVFAKKYRLGYLAVNVGTEKKIVTIDDDYRKTVSLDSVSKLLDSVALDRLVNEIKMQHSVALYRMRQYLNTNVIFALQSKGATTTFDKNGFINVLDKTGKLHYKIWATARPPKVNDYHYTDISHSSGVKVIFGPEFQEQKREILNTWLSQKATVTYFNEGEILSLINKIYP